MARSLYVTTTIPYVNGAPHVGFALELVQADVIARYQRLRGADVRFQSGTDENAFKNVLSARARGVPVAQFVDENAARFRSLATLLDISIDQFVRTTSTQHRTAVAAFLSQLQREDIYRQSYQGLYCSGCEDFYLAGDLDDGRCPDHGVAPVAIAEENIFFRLSRYQTAIHDLITSGHLCIIPESRRLEVLRFIEGGLVDISISRDARRSEGWGIPFPGDRSQIVYVWIDALINYLSGLGCPDVESGAHYWRDATKIHLIGKNVWKFHAIYWPALLLSAGLTVPDQIVVHGFLTNDGRKISKSSGDAVDPAEYVRRIGTDGVRYFLLGHVRPFDDNDVSVERLDAAYEADLANGLGNLVSRVTALCEAASVPGTVPGPGRAPADYHEHVAAFRFDLALGTIRSEITRLNQEIATSKPWEDLKADRLTRAQAKLLPLVDRLAAIGYWLGPFLPSTSAAIRELLSQTLISKGSPLFPRRRREVVVP
jgi:methionyl-tRNA synthetase